LTKAYARRFGQYALLLLVALSINFALPRLAPGGPLQAIAGESVGLLSEEERANLLAAYGLDQPLPVQFVQYLGQIASGDLGNSFQAARPVSEIVAARLPWTLLLAGSALLISSALGVLLGVVGANRRGKRTDIGLTSLFGFLQSLPSFWIGMVFIAIFATRLGWLPTFGAASVVPPDGVLATIADRARHLVMPLTVLVLAGIPSMYLTTRYAMLGVLQEDFIDTAYSKGLRGRVILFRHALRNALLPVLTVFALHVGFVVSGATIIETVFSYPGVGRMMYEAVLARDYPLLQAGFLMITVSVIFANLVADLLYPVLDPRARLPAA
jgi:peptide/nickel transport system permease protein